MTKEAEDPTQTRLRSSAAFEFRTANASVIFDYLTKAFTLDYMTKSVSRADSGWRSLGDIARDIHVSTSLIYAKKRNQFSPPVKELVERGFVEKRFFQRERGRGGEVMRLRVAFDNEVIKNYVEQKIRGGPKVDGANKAQTSRGSDVDGSDSGTQEKLDRLRIAVLPFANISPDPADEFFADGMTEELISALSLINELSVISRTSVMSYKNQQNKRTLDIGRELCVGTILEGSIRKAGDRVRISVQLIDAQSDGHLWIQNYDRTLEDIFAIQSEIANRVAESLESRLLPEKRHRIEHANTRNVDAHLLYLKGRQSFFTYTKDGFENAIKFFEMAIEKDPLYALAFANAGEACFHLGLFDFSTKEMFSKCKKFAEKALLIDESLPEAHLALGCGLWGEWNFEKGEREVRRAIELNPNLSESYYYLGWFLVHTSRFDQAIIESEKATELDPLSSLAWFVVGSAYLYSRKDYDKAIDYLEKALKFNPLNAAARTNLGLSLVQKGMTQSGIEELMHAAELWTPNIDPETEFTLAYAYARVGFRNKAEEILSLLLNGVERNPAWAGPISAVYSVLEDKERAFNWLEKGFQARSGLLLYLGVEFAYDNVRADPRFDALLVRIGLKKLAQIEAKQHVIDNQNAKLTVDEKSSSAGSKASRIAVLPFANISPDPKDEYFSDGMTEELISTLSKIRGFKVISRTSVLRYKQTSKSLSEIARELNVGAILEGSVRKAADDLRITAQLIDVENDEHLWSEDYDRKFENVFSLQKEIAQKVAESLKVTILTKDGREIGKKPTQSLEAYTLYLKARNYKARWTLESCTKAIEYCEQAIRKDPNYAEAYAEIALNYMVIGFFEHSPSYEVFPKAESFAERAIRLDDTIAESHLALGAVRYFYYWDFRSGEIEFKRAIGLNPSFVDAHNYLAEALAIARRCEEAALEVEKSRELDPLSADTCAHLGGVLLLCGRFDDSIEMYRNAIEMDPSSATSHDNLGCAYIEKGMIDLAISEIRKSMELGGGMDNLTDLTHAYAKAGKMDEVRKILDDLLSRKERGERTETAIAGVYANLGDVDKTMEWLEKAYQNRRGYLIAVNADHSFDELRDEPRFQALMKKIGF